MALHGIDVSHWQGGIDWAAVAASQDFAIMKATEGTAFVDSKFKTNIAASKLPGLVRGAYHFMRSGDPVGQARHFVRTVGSFAGVIPVLDVEKAASGSYPTIGEVREFVAEFRRLVPGRTIVIYTGGWFWKGYLGNPKGSDLGPLWHSEYESTQAEINDGPELDNYGGWGACKIWQYTSTGRSPGVSGNCDLNIFYGSASELAALAGGAPTATKDWFDMADKDTLKAAVREVLNEGTAYGYTTWRDTSKGVVSKINSLTNLVRANKVNYETLADMIIARIPEGEAVDVEVVKAGVRAVFAELAE